MSLGEVLFHPSLLVAVVVFGILGIVLAFIEYSLFARFSNNPASDWIAQHIMVPVARIFTVLVFISIASPIMFGIESAPSFGELMAQGEGRGNTLINVTFAVTLFISVLPVVGRMPGLVLPLQGMMATAMVASWIFADAPLALWPGWLLLGLIILWALFSAWIVRNIAHLAGAKLESATGYANIDILLYEALILLFQVPAILVYALFLGGQSA